MKISIQTLLVAIGALFVASCGQENRSEVSVADVDCPPDRCVVISGKFSEDHVASVRDFGSSLDYVVVNSIGGKSRFAREIAEVMAENDAGLLIVGECSSACFEFLVPTASSVTAISEPIIAVHGNPIVTHTLLQRAGYVRPSHCPWPSRDFLQDLYARKGLKTDFVQKTIEMLGDASVAFTVKENGCLSSLSFTSRNQYWEPTRDEIEQYLGVEISGELCRDKIESCL